MKTKTILIVFATFLFGLIFFTPGSYAQQKSADQAKEKKTITIHITKEVDGNTVVIDTTVVTDGDFDADAFLEEKGVMKDMPQAVKNVEKHVIICHPGSNEFSWSGSDGNLSDTIIINEDQVFSFNDQFEMPAPPPPHAFMPFDFNYHMPGEFPHMESPRFEEMLEGMARTFGLENVMPLGEMKQMVVKKKRNGKKVIITFEDRKNEDSWQEPSNTNKEEKVIIYKYGDQGMAPQNEEKVNVNGKPGEKIVIHKDVKKTENGEEIIIDAEVENPTPVKKEKKVIIITEEGTK